MTEKCIISQKARDSIIKTYEKGEQSMIFINRRGFSRTLKCEQCGYEFKCENCDNLLSYHKNKNFLKCHYCGYKIDKIEKCDKCNSYDLKPNKGIGVEQVEKEIKTFCNAKTILFSSDEINKENDIEMLTKEIKDGDVDIIIGTQIMTKGHHFPRLTNIVVLDIDGMSLDGNFRSFERMFQMLYQLSGRAGREKKDSTIYIQTLNPENKVLQAIKNNDIENFYKNEIIARKKNNLPPYSRLISITVSSQFQDEALNTANLLLNELKKNVSKPTEIFGPTESNVFYLKKNYRYRFLLKSPKNSVVLDQLNKIKNNFKYSKKVQVKFDVDCYNFL